MPGGRRLPARAGACRATRRFSPPGAPESRVRAPRAAGESWSDLRLLRVESSATLSCDDLCEKAGAVRKAADAKDLRQGLTHIRKRRARAEIDAPANLAAGHQQRHVLARMIGACGGGIIAMVGCQHQQIALTQLRQHGREPDVEPFEISGVPLD